MFSEGCKAIRLLSTYIIFSDLEKIYCVWYISHGYLSRFQLDSKSSLSRTLKQQSFIVSRDKCEKNSLHVQNPVNKSHIHILQSLIFYVNGPMGRQRHPNLVWQDKVEEKFFCEQGNNFRQELRWIISKNKVMITNISQFYRNYCLDTKEPSETEINKWAY